MMQIYTIATRAFLPPKDDLFDLLDESVTDLRDGDVLCISSKIVAIHQGRCLKIDSSIDKDELIAKEAERFVPRSRVPGALAILTMKEHTLIASAGIDESNGNGFYILWPEHPYAAAREVWSHLRKGRNIENIGVIFTDSHTMPLRSGVTGISIGFAGFYPVDSYIGKNDIFGRPFSMSRTNVVDAVAAAAVLHMGEGSEQTPLAIVRGVPHLRFTTDDTSGDLLIDPEVDIYRPLLECFEDAGEK
ncbi:MAG: coenzyme F420-0:L-glutamate ligase [Patescibacteria group bacterium]|jgi:F420-0:gamma-glutamyl ligase